MIGGQRPLLTVLAGAGLLLASALPAQAQPSAPSPSEGETSAAEPTRRRAGTRRTRERGRSRRASRAARPTRTTRARRARTSRRAAHGRLRRSWRQGASRAELAAWRAQSPRPLVLRPVGAPERFELVPEPDGSFAPEALERAQVALADDESGSEREVHPRLLLLLHRAALHFEVPYVHVISGYRPESETSRHGQGRAVDVVLPGVSNEALARFFRRQGFVGVGTYPHSGFVHVDVRDRSYYWVDGSGPGQPSQHRAVRAAERAPHDSAARVRGELSVTPFEAR